MGAGQSSRAPLSLDSPGSELLPKYESIEQLVEQGEAAWDSLSAEQQRDMDEVIAALKSAADFNPMKEEKEKRGGDEDAMYHLAVVLADGKGCKREEQQAVVFLKEGSQRGHLMCRFFLGEMYYFNRGVPANNAKYFNQFKGVKLWKDVAEAQTYVPAFERLAEAYKTGIGVMEADPVKAADYYAKATNSHVADAYSELAEMYEKGSGGMVKDEAKAAQQYQFSVDQGNDKAKYNLGHMYMDGRGVAQDKSKGEALFKEAVTNGNANAQYHQAILLSRRKGTDVFKAIGLLTHSARKGHAKARQQLDRIRAGEPILDEEIPDDAPKASKSKFKFQKGVAGLMLGGAAKMNEAAAAAAGASGPSSAGGGAGGTGAGAAVTPTKGEEAAGFDWEGKPLDARGEPVKKSAEPWSPFSPMSATLSSMAKGAKSMVSSLAKKMPTRYRTSKVTPTKAITQKGT
eukprot:CAMPEP_0172595050 /NCGR_PEP_ID=MMETSP1068-20121228/14569_1 /TAXON_ID=35684 /ORGANISM="Pseudopedinella elastica, Strain CCMP716" /LENGTH=457 /DNA_ID=CAMNT_0013393387 /DNA_START=113 /DNA_END=1486 /DNA_ORIENTATION=-